MRGEKGGREVEDPTCWPALGVGEGRNRVMLCSWGGEAGDCQVRSYSCRR